MQTRTKHDTFFLALATALAATACGGSSSSGKDTSSSGTTAGGAGGSSASGVTSGGGTNSRPNTSNSAATNSSNTASGDTGGSGGSGGTTSTVGGAGGVDTTSAGGLGGTSGSGGASGGSDSGGASSSGGSSGDGGTAGSGGSGPTGVIGVLGDPCDTPGQLACAGNHQKLTVVCGGDGEWEVNETCGETEFCDSAEGDTTGVCVEPSPACMERTIDERFCQDGDAYSCMPDGVTPKLAETCDVRCIDGACVNEMDVCPMEGIVFNCDPACGEPWDGCGGGEEMDSPAQGVPVLFRTGAASDASFINCDGGMSYYTLQLAVPVPPDLKVAAAPPWRVMFDLDALDDCDFSEAATCAIGELTNWVVLVTEDPDAPPTDVLLEYASSISTCP